MQLRIESLVGNLSVDRSESELLHHIVSNRTNSPGMVWTMGNPMTSTQVNAKGTAAGYIVVGGAAAQAQRPIRSAHLVHIAVLLVEESPSEMLAAAGVSAQKSE